MGRGQPRSRLLHAWPMVAVGGGEGGSALCGDDDEASGAPPTLFGPPRPMRQPTRAAAATWAPPALTMLRNACADVRCDETGAPAWSESWSALHFMCPDSLKSAAEILDSKTLTRVVARQSRRTFFVVEGQGRNKQHTVVPGFCTCQAYCHRVAARPEELVCKHELAVLLAAPLGKLLDSELDDAEWCTAFQRATTIPMIDYDPHLAVGDSASPGLVQPARPGHAA